jgi:hypothetical protein
MRGEEIDDNWFWKPQHSPHRNKRLHAIPLSACSVRDDLAPPHVLPSIRGLHPITPM